jgi:hypothetical protein
MEFFASTYREEVSKYGPQANIPIHQNGSALSVYARGMLSNNTYQWISIVHKAEIVLCRLKSQLPQNLP